MAHTQINNLSLYYEWHGQPGAFPVVCVNGLLADTTGWAFQVPVLAQHFHVLLYDCRGQGQSDKPPGPYALHNHLTDLVGLLDALQVPRCHIVGLSNGGAIALALAARHPERVARLVVADTVAQTDAVMLAKLQSWLAALEQGGPRLRFDVATPWVWGRTFLAANAELLATLRDKAATANPAAVRALIAGAIFEDDSTLQAQLATIQAPALVMVGEDDLLTPPSYARAIAAALPNARALVVPDAGHALPIEQPTLFNAVAQAFLQEYAR